MEEPQIISKVKIFGKQSKPFVFASPNYNGIGYFFARPYAIEIKDTAERYASFYKFKGNIVNPKELVETFHKPFILLKPSEQGQKKGAKEVMLNKVLFNDGNYYYAYKIAGIEDYSAIEDAYKISAKEFISKKGEKSFIAWLNNGFIEKVFYIEEQALTDIETIEISNIEMAKLNDRIAFSEAEVEGDAEFIRTSKTAFYDIKIKSFKAFDVISLIISRKGCFKIIKPQEEKQGIYIFENNKLVKTLNISRPYLFFISKKEEENN